MRLHQESLLLFRLRHLRETYCFSLCKLLEYSCVNILPQITQITQRNAASCIISQRNSKNCIPLCGNCLSLRKSAASALADIFALTVFRLRKSARSAGDFWGFVCAI